MRGLGKEEAWRQDTVRNLIGIDGPVVQGDWVEAEDSNEEMSLHGKNRARF